MNQLIKKPLKRILEAMLLIASVSLLTLLAEAKVYKWKAEDGSWQYSDLPPVNMENTETMKTQTYVKTEKPKPEPQKVKEEKSPLISVDAENAQVMQQNCENARRNLNTYAIGGRIRRSNKFGEMVYLNEQEIAKAKASAQKQIEQYCR